MKKLLISILLINVIVLTGCGNTGPNKTVKESVTVATTDASTPAKEETSETNQKITETKIENETSLTAPAETVNVLEIKENKKNDNKEVCLKKAQEAIDDIGGYSPKVLRLELEVKGYTDSEIDYAIDNLKVDWTEQAKQYCKDLLNMDYTRQEAYSELVGWGFTTEEAKAAMAAVYY